MSYPHPAQQEFYSQAGSSDVGAFPSSSSGASAAKSDGITTQLTTDYPTIANLSREDLEALADGRGDPESEAYFEALIDTLPQVRALYDEHEALLRRNEELASE